MALLHQLETWADHHHPRWLDLVRILLGVFIFLKGIEFLQDLELLREMIAQTGMGWGGPFLAHYIAPAHLFGGMLITVGLLTRWAVAAQIPILIGAVFWVNLQNGFNADLVISLTVIALLIVFLLYGSGKWSVDEFLKEKKSL